MTIQEPSDGTNIIVIPNDTTGFPQALVRRDSEAKPMYKDGHLFGPEKRWFRYSQTIERFNWDEVKEMFTGDHEIRVVDAETSTVTPDRMQDGKRYRVVFEGIAEREHIKQIRPNLRLRTGVLDLDERCLPGATRIEEIS